MMNTQKSNQDAQEDQGEQSIILITTFIVPTMLEEPFLAWWRMVKPFFSMQPGFVSAKLHRSLDQKEQYRFINIAEWHGDAETRETLSHLWSSAPQPALPGFEWRPAFYEVIETV